jgi:uncharacterized membrane-anchored protein YitT (DUF2179 family)
MKVSKVSLVILVIALIVLFELSSFMYGKASETTLSEVIELQSRQTDKLILMVIEKQKELEQAKNALEEANNKISALMPVKKTKRAKK